MNDLSDRVIAVFAYELMLRPARLGKLTELSDDLQLDEMERAVIGEALEQEFGIVVGHAAMEFDTIGDAIDFVEHALSMPAALSPHWFELLAA